MAFLKLRDALWLGAYPVYQMVGTFRHEASHALAGLVAGRHIDEFVIWPTARGSRLWWGYVRFDGQIDWPVAAAPYVVDLLTFTVCYWLCRRHPLPRPIYLNAVIFGLVSPLVNSAYAYAGAFSRFNDVSYLFHRVPPHWVHLYFAATLSVFFCGACLALSNQPRKRAAFDGASRHHLEGAERSLRTSTTKGTKNTRMDDPS